MVHFYSGLADAASNGIGMDQFVDEIDRARDMKGDEEFLYISDLLRRAYGQREYVEKFIRDSFLAHGTDHIIDGYGDVSLLLGATKFYSFRTVKWLPEKEVVLPGLRREALVYDLVHNHDFNLVTKGIIGSGYETDVYRFDADKLLGAIGESVNLEFQGRFRLSEGSVMWYEKFHDVHTQYAPDSFSMSFNVIPKDRDIWHGQFIFDRQSNTVKEFARNGSTRILGLMNLLCELEPSEENEALVTELAKETSNQWLKVSIGFLISETWKREIGEIFETLKVSERFRTAMHSDPSLFSARGIR